MSYNFLNFLFRQTNHSIILLKYPFFSRFFASSIIRLRFSNRSTLKSLKSLSKKATFGSGIITNTKDCPSYLLEIMLNISFKSFNKSSTSALLIDGLLTTFGLSSLCAMYLSRTTAILLTNWEWAWIFIRI